MSGFASGVCGNCVGEVRQLLWNMTDHKCVVEAEKSTKAAQVAAAMHTDAEAAKDKNKCHLGDIT